MQLDAAKIKRALADVHLAERTSENPEGVDRDTAAAAAAVAHGLTAAEDDILRNALLLPPRGPARGAHVLLRDAHHFDDLGTVQGPGASHGMVRVRWHFADESYDEDSARLVEITTAAHAARVIALLMRTRSGTSPEVRHAGGDADAFDVHIGKLRIAVSCSLPD